MELRRNVIIPVSELEKDAGKVSERCSLSVNTAVSLAKGGTQGGTELVGHSPVERNAPRTTKVVNTGMFEENRARYESKISGGRKKHIKVENGRHWHSTSKRRRGGR